MTLKTLLIPLAVLLASGASAQAVGKPDDEAQHDALETAVPLKLEVVFSRYDGETKIGRLPFTMLLNSDDKPARLKMGLMVPLTVGRKDVPATIQFKDVVTGVRCRARPLSDERFALACQFDQDAVYSPNGEDAAPDKAELAPAIRRFNSDTTLVLRDGQTAQHSATDPLTGEVLEVDVTLHVMK
jgi:hypothetical protein